MPDTYTFSESAGRFREAASGRFVSEATVRTTIDKIADGASSDMAKISESLVDGKVTVAEWQAKMRELIRVSNSGTSVIATGGNAAMTSESWGSLGQTVKTEYAHLDAFAAGIASGDIPLDGRIVARARMYGASSRIAYENVRSRGDRARGYNQERNILHASESCSACLGETARGWVSIGELVSPGSRTCLSSCRCTLERRKEPAGVAV